MGRYSYKRNKRTVIICTITAAILVFIVVAYANLDNTPTWNEVFKTFGLTDENDYPECIRFADVGQGDCAVIKSGGRTALIDTGTPESAEALCRKLRNLNIRRIDAMMLSHNHDDHIGGARLISDRFSIENLILPDISNTESPIAILGEVKTETLAGEGECYTAKSGMYYSVGNIKISVLYCYYSAADENDRSVITAADFGEYRFLFTGDAGKETEKMMLKDGIDLKSDVLKVGHHGSSGSSSAEFLSAVSPEYAVISCGKDNQYSHPHDAALQRIEKTGARIYRTDLNGDIVFSVKNGKLAVDTEK